MRKDAPYASGSVAGGVGIMSMDYLGGFQYQGTALKFFPTAEGYVQATALKVGFAYSYVYNYTDHLGNIRLSYAQDPENPNVLKILEESHYYPFGLKHTNYNSDQLAFKEKDPGPGLMLMAAAAAIDPVPQFVYNYKYNGKELQDEMGMNWYDYGARNYDPAIGRWMNMDPLAEQGRRWSPYAYAMDNPVYFIDPDGMWPWPSWSSVKSYAKGAWKTGANMAVGLATSTYNNAKNGLTEGNKVIQAYKKGGAKAAARQYANSLYETSGAKAIVETAQKASTGDAEAIGSLAVTVTAAVVTHRVAKGNGSKAAAASETGAAETSTLAKTAQAGNSVESAGVTTATESNSTKVFRVFGGDAKAEGFSWTTENPNNVSNFRNQAGLPSGGASGSTNTGQFVIEGSVNSSDIINTRSALPLDGNAGGLPELIINPKNVNIERVSGANPPF